LRVLKQKRASLSLGQPRAFGRLATNSNALVVTCLEDRIVTRQITIRLVFNLRLCQDPNGRVLGSRGDGWHVGQACYPFLVEPIAYARSRNNLSLLC